MKQKLPEYVAKCLISAGYDEIEVLSTMGILVKSKEIRLKRLKALLRRGMQTALNIIHFHLTHLSFHLGIEFKYAILFEN